MDLTGKMFHSHLRGGTSPLWMPDISEIISETTLSLQWVLLTCSKEWLLKRGMVIYPLTAEAVHKAMCDMTKERHIVGDRERSCESCPLTSRALQSIGGVVAILTDRLTDMT
ncbi:hypothetical protein DPMN_073166 [Dreissena polymorpha]|uniref:Uncharacterized protein n=1 Tax=Dreissena polymorpha TaxID=45954 RepID=A0A9D4BYN7_DREPO|nr:hypothetical protein DPMN_073166 [Dreissena polymorpha]